MAMVEEQAGSFANGKVSMILVYDDVDMLCRSVDYVNDTDYRAYLEVQNPGGNPVRFELSERRNSKVTIPQPMSPSLGAGTQVRLGWPSGTGIRQS